MYQEASEPLERRISELQSQIDRLSMSLHLWREQQGHLEPVEGRLTALTDQCAEIVERWTVVGERQAQAVGELEERLRDWDNAESRVRRETAEHMHELQRSIEQEWSALRRMHEEPVKQLREQASTLTEVSVAAATSALNGFERAEARLSELEASLNRRLAELSDQVRMAVSELRSPAGSDTRALTASGAAQAWPLDDVVRLHNQLREAPDADDSRSPRAVAPEGPTERPAVRVEPAEPAEVRPVIDLHAETPHDRPSSWLIATIAAVLIIAVGTGVAVYQLREQARAAASRVAEIERQSQAAAQTAAQQVAAARDDAAKRITEAQNAALKAQVIGTVLAAPDLVRYNLAGRDAAAIAGAQALWSRTRGFVFSGSRLPALPPGSTYQVWLLTNAEPVSAGVFEPDSAGRATVAMDTVPQIPRPITGVMVTREAGNGRSAPIGPVLLARQPQQP